MHEQEPAATSTRFLGQTIVIIALILATEWSAVAEIIEVDPPIKMIVRPDGGERLRGSLTAYNKAGFTMKLEDDSTQRVAWDALPPDRVMKIQEKFLSPDDARGWFQLGVMLYGREDGRREAERALRRAVNAEPDLEGKAERVRQGEAVPYDEAEAAEPESNTTDGGHTHVGDGPAGRGGPVSVGTLQSEFWGELSEEVMSSSVDQLKQHMVEAQQKINLRLPLYKDASEFFLFYTDLPPAEARRWAGLLDKMYARLCDIFGLDPQQNVFRGRCLIVIFQREANYHRYQALVHGMLNSQGSAGLCRSYLDGRVEVTMFKQRSDLDTARVLVHEAVHGFNHRYRSHPYLVSWINEGLAEYVSSGLVENSGFGQSNFARSVNQGLRDLRARKSLGGNSFFHTSHIDGWQYPVAQLLTEYMIRQSGPRYRDFINAIKDGKHWETALKEDYGVSVEKLVDAFGNSIRIRGLRP
ncbi:MAG: hypothetical protein AAGH99_00855 [Planctomycetota bacterium]